MPHFFFHVHNRSGVTVDNEGVDIADCRLAHEFALMGIRSLLSEEVLSGQMDMHGHLDLTDASGTLVERIRFDDAVTILPAEPGGGIQTE